MEKAEFAKLFDHTILKATATLSEVHSICDEAIKYGFCTVCVNSSMLAEVETRLRGSGVLPISVVGFALGAMSTAAKVEETRLALGEGAREIDMVVNLGWYFSGLEALVRGDIEALAKLTKQSQAKLKVIIETAYLNDDQIAELSLWSAKSGADFVKTSTGFGPRGASVNDIRIMKGALVSAGLDQQVEIKASGGIRTLDDVNKLVEAGATRIGASASVDIYRRHLEAL